MTRNMKRNIVPNALPSPLAGPFAEIGRQIFDGRGNTDGTATASANGNLRHFTFQGTYVVTRTAQAP